MRDGAPTSRRSKVPAGPKLKVGPNVRARWKGEELGPRGSRARPSSDATPVPPPSGSRTHGSMVGLEASRRMI